MPTDVALEQVDKHKQQLSAICNFPIITTENPVYEFPLLMRSRSTECLSLYLDRQVSVSQNDKEWGDLDFMAAYSRTWIIVFPIYPTYLKAVKNVTGFVMFTPIEKYLFFIPFHKVLVLPEVEHLSITLLMDNYTDRLLPLSDKHTIRPPMIRNERFLPPPIAEHGFSALIEVSCNNENVNRTKDRVSKGSSTFLFDCGISENGVIYNADTLGMGFSNISAIILSHGHLDHIAALPNVLKKIGTSTRLVCHPDAFLKRWIVFPNGKGRAKMPFLEKEKLQRQGAKVIMKQGPSVISEDSIDDFSSISTHNSNSHSSFLLPKLIITGQIPRNTLFEKGFPIQYKEDPDENNLAPDTWVNDDQAIVVNIKKKRIGNYQRVCARRNHQYY